MLHISKKCYSSCVCVCVCVGTPANAANNSSTVATKQTYRNLSYSISVLIFCLCLASTTAHFNWRMGKRNDFLVRTNNEEILQYFFVSLENFLCQFRSKHLLLRCMHIALSTYVHHC